MQIILSAFTLSANPIIDNINNRNVISVEYPR